MGHSRAGPNHTCLPSTRAPVQLTETVRQPTTGVSRAGTGGPPDVIVRPTEVYLSPDVTGPAPIPSSSTVPSPSSSCVLLLCHGTRYRREDGIVLGLILVDLLLFCLFSSRPLFTGSFVTGPKM